MEDKDIVLDEKTKLIVINLVRRITDDREKLRIVLEAVVNTKFPESNDTYELSQDLDKLIVKTS